MGESLVHRNLVLALLEEINAAEWSVKPFVYADADGSSTPPMIGSVRPDVYARFIGQNRVVVGEAKSSNDLETAHTRDQFEEYFAHIANTTDGELWLAVPWLSAGTAVRICSAVKKRVRSIHRFRVSAWMFGESTYSRVWYG